MDAFASRFQHGAHQRDCGAFAIGACHMKDRRQLLLGMSEFGEQIKCAPERQINLARMEREETLEHFLRLIDLWRFIRHG
jgi:hypothetical protein